MTKFKIGDKFIPRKSKSNNSNGWVSELDRFDGKVLTVSSIGRADVLEVKETGFVFDPDWCEKVEEHIPAVGETIDWEQRRYEIAKDFMTAQINSLYLKSKGWSYEDEARYAVNAADVLIKQLQKSPEK